MLLEHVGLLCVYLILDMIPAKSPWVRQALRTQVTYICGVLYVLFGCVLSVLCLSLCDLGVCLNVCVVRVSLQCPNVRCAVNCAVCNVLCAMCYVLCAVCRVPCVVLCEY